jgi:very-short-patch-repair endonuclease
MRHSQPVRPRIPLPAPLAIGPFTSQKGRAAGLGPHRLRGSDLLNPFQGVLIPVKLDITFLLLCRALLERLPDGAFFCGITAARIIGMPLPAKMQDSSTFEIGVMAPLSPPSGRGIRGHMLRVDASAIQVWNGLPITSPEQTWCDLSALLHMADLIAAGDYLIHWDSPMTSAERLDDAVRRRGRHRGVISLRAAVGQLDERSESPQESKLRVIISHAGLRGLSANFPITTSGGFNYRADLAFPERKLILEYQSAFHETPDRFRSDMTRISRLETDGWKVMQINKDDMDRPMELVSRVRRALASRPHFTF